MPARSLLVALTAASSLGLLAGCSSASASPTDSPASASGPGPVQVVASTNVWGDLAATVGGDAVEVTSIITDPSADPHSYEASAQTQLALSKAALVIENGGGYDDFVDTMLGSLDSAPEVINAVDVSGKTAAAGEELNEHVWYDFPTVVKVVEEIRDDLSSLDPAHADQYEANATRLTGQIGDLESSVATLKESAAGDGVAITEPVPLYLLDAAGLVNKTPEKFSEAIEEETDVTPTVLQETLDLFSSHAVDALVYNAQTTGPQTEQVLQAAKQAGVPAVPVTETLPEGDTYVTWMKANIDAIAQALGA